MSCGACPGRRHSGRRASELRRGAAYVWVTVALTVLAADVADALTIAWDAFLQRRPG